MNEEPTGARATTAAVVCAVVALGAVAFGVAALRHTRFSGLVTTLVPLGAVVVGISLSVAFGVAAQRRAASTGARSMFNVLYVLPAISAYRASAAGGLPRGAMLFGLAGYFGALSTRTVTRRSLGRPAHNDP